MPWGWECRAKLIKQVPAKPTKRKGKISGETPTPSAAQYEPPEIIGGKGFSKIKRSPAYTFGHLTPTTLAKPVTKANAPLFNIQGLGRSGRYKVPCGVVSPHIEPVGQQGKQPGPANYAPAVGVRYKRPPAFTMRPAARPPYEPWDMWTPPPNMYWPPIPGKKAPAFTLGIMAKPDKIPDFPGPGEHEPNFDYVKKNKPAFSFGEPFKRIKAPRTPAPNRYCEKKFMVSKRTIPAPSFGIRHTKYLGEQAVFLKPPKLNYLTSDAS
ncbi:hypothetical protein ABMA27_006665 [Loxostege sticticalis]|uniref:Uncharacterized protein n=1 Tax=Loxostege sticticalis TaxID=481309 RepID=A0ABR3IJY7_LOXSC